MRKEMGELNGFKVTLHKTLINFKREKSNLKVEKLQYTFNPNDKKKKKVAQLCPTLCDSMDYTVHGILQAEY